MLKVTLIDTEIAMSETANITIEEFPPIDFVKNGP